MTRMATEEQLLERLRTIMSVEGPDGTASLLDLFGDHRQLLLYHFMFGPDADKGCVGCSMVVDNMGHPAHLEARGTNRVLVSRAPLEKLEAFKQRMGWTIPWYSSFGSDFNYDFGVTSDRGEMFGLSVFLRDDDRIFRTYFTDRRGVEHLGSNWSYLDMTRSAAGRSGRMPLKEYSRGIRMFGGVFMTNTMIDYVRTVLRLH